LANFPVSMVIFSPFVPVIVSVVPNIIRYVQIRKKAMFHCLLPHLIDELLS